MGTFLSDIVLQVLSFVAQNERENIRQAMDSVTAIINTENDIIRSEIMAGNPNVLTDYDNFYEFSDIQLQLYNTRLISTRLSYLNDITSYEGIMDSLEEVKNYLTEYRETIPAARREAVNIALKDMDTYGEAFTVHYNILKVISEDFFVHVNLSPKQITRDTLTQEVIDAIETNGISPHNLILETTETSMMLELDKGVKLLNELRHNGVRIAVDDFGTGYSSLSYLRTLPVDEIKIDRSFVSGIEDDVQSRNFLIGIVKIIQSMQYTVCVEGIETKGQKDILTGLQVDMLQGYLFDKPVPADEFEIKYLKK